jgi:hypothetical protein
MPPPPSYLSAHHLERAKALPAPEEFALAIVNEELAKRVEDVIVLPDGTLFARAYLPDGKPMEMFLRVGQVRS